MEIRDRLASIKLQLDGLDRSHDETAELAAKVFELSQTLKQQWLVADYPEKRRLLGVVFLNPRLDGVTLVLAMKPFDILAKRLLSENSRGDRRWTFPNESFGNALLLRAFRQVIEFTADEFQSARRM